MNTYYANDRYAAVLTAGYSVGQTTLYVSAVPNHVPTIVVAAKGTDNETIFEVTGKTTNSLTGVSRLRGANVDLDAQTPLTCLNNEEFINQYASIYNQLINGWMPAEETWTYASANTFTISGDKTGKYQKGDKIKLTNSTVKYFYIIGVSYSDPNTTVTVTGGSDYALASGTITNNYYSKVANPQGFPAYFNYTPTWSSDGGAFTNNPTVTYARFKIKEGYCQVEARAVYPATPGGSGRTTMTLPLTPAQIWTAGQGIKTYTGFYTLAVGAYNTGDLYFEKYDGTTCIEANGEFGVGVTYAF